MKFLIVDTYYPTFLRTFWSNYVSFKNSRYSTILNLLLKQKFGTSDYYSGNLKKLGHQAWDVIANDEVSQQKWAQENHIALKKHVWWSKFQELPYIHKFIGRPTWVQDIVLSQVKNYFPDVVYVHDLSVLNSDTLNNIKQMKALLVGQIACPLPAIENLKCYDLILTSFPHYVSMFRKLGIASEYLKIGFEPSVWNQIGAMDRVFDVVFIGSFTPHHSQGTKLLEKLASQVNVHVWGQGIQFLSPSSPLRRNFHGQAWGVEMYKILAQSKIVINRHIKAAGKYANNMRLYESTGMGAMVLTDFKINLNDLFAVGKEIESYTNSKELVEKVKFYLRNSKKREKIANAGQRKTLKEHTYQIRMKELINILHKYYV